MDILLESTTQPLLEMANLQKQDYNIPVNCWVSAETQNKHKPRIKVQQDKGSRVNYGNFCSVSIEEEPQVLAGKWRLSSKDTAEIFDFIADNVEALLQLWRSECANSEAMTNIRTKRATNK